jgi:hypothetical protein
VYIDRQAAVVFELLYFPGNYTFSEPMLVRLKKKLVADQTLYSHVLIEEIDLTLKHIQQNSK